MSDHAWAEEQIAAYLAGGLDAREAERLESHARECAACADSLADARRLDRGLLAMFAPARPGVELEDRAVARLRDVRPASPAFARWAVRTAAAVAAVVVLGGFGALASTMMDGGHLRMPGSARRDRGEEEARLREAAEQSERAAQELSNEDVGLDARFDAVRRGSELRTNLEAALPDIDRVDKLNVDAAVTFDNIAPPDKDTTASALPGLNFHGEYTSDGTTNGNMFGTYSGRSGATKTQLLRPGVAFSPDGRFLASGYANPYYNGPNPTVLAFDPAKHAATFAPLTDGQPKSGEQKAPDKAPSPKPAPTAEDAPKDPPAAPDPARRVIIRSGDIEFEVPSFDPAQAAVAKLVNNIKGAFIATINSEKLPNGKVKGSITVRVPPEHLDGLVLDLRKEIGATGELKGVRLGSQDVTKQYYDLESRLKAARTMEQRLLQIIKEGKGTIKELLEAEKELGVWRTKIEEFEGEIRYFANLAALSTLTVSLTEISIRSASVLTEQERVQAGVEVEDVDKAYQELLKAITDAKGRVLKSEVKQLSAGQFNAGLQFEVAPDAGGPMRDRLRMLGRLARLEIDRVTQAEGGTLPTDAKTKRGDTVFMVQIYNLANVAPRETATVQVAAVDVPAAYQALRDAAAKTTGRTLAAQLNEQDKQNVSAQFDFEVRRADEPAVRAALEAAGEVVSRQVARAPEGDNVTDTKVLYRVALLAANKLKPREQFVLGIEVGDVDAQAAVFTAQATAAGAKPTDAQFAREKGGRVTAKLAFEVPLPAAAGLVSQFKAAGTVRVAQSVRDPQATEGRFATARVEVTLMTAEHVVIVPEGEGIWPQVRRGLAYSASVLLTSVTWVVFGLCVVLPWALIALAVYRVARRLFRPAVVVAVPPATTATTTPTA